MRLVRVDGVSMRETLQDRDLLAVANRPLCGGPGAGDIVVVRKASFDPEPIVKRVIATAGRRVDVRYVVGRAVFLAVPGPSVDTKTRAFGRVGTLG